MRTHSAVVGLSVLCLILWGCGGSKSLPNDQGAKANATIRGAVQLAGGTAATTGTSVTLVGPDGVSHTTQVDQQGQYSFANLPAGAYTVNATCPGYRGQTPNVTVSEGATAAADVTLHETTPGAIQGVVQNEGGGQASSLTVVTLCMPDGTTRTTNIDAQGHYSFADVPTGSYTVKATCPGFRGQTDVTVTEGATTTAAIALHDLTPVGGIIGTVTDTEHHPLADVTIRVRPDGAETSTDANGYYALPRVAPGQQSIDAYKTGYDGATIADVTVVDGQATTVDITFTKAPVTGGTLVGTVRGPDGNPLSGMSVSVWDNPYGKRPWNARTNANGHYELANLPANTYIVNAGGLPPYAFLQVFGVAITLGQTTTVDLQLSFRP